MATRDLTMGMIFLSQTLTGILGNFSLLSHYLYLYLTGCKFRSTDLVIKHLSVANCLVILSRGVPQTMAALGMKHFLRDIGCKLVFYVHRVGRDVSICSTCLLSISQAITISPRNTRWAELKAKAPKYIGFSVALFWMVNLILNVMVPLHVTENGSDKNMTREVDYGYSYSVISDRFTVYGAVYGALVLLRDIFFVVILMSRATHSILILVSTFVSLSSLSSLFHICLIVLNNPSMWLVNTSALIAGSFPTVSPYILMSHDSRVLRLIFTFSRYTESPA
uniref:vomeronasal 1 receptor oryCunV1R1592 n=1 Tax=Oryctolagus cuniculus TaxID=9986 RepID=UPI0001CE1D91|nr:vomeronasal 1 receptor oryCunV1R1592 [Oryctolagus cuniculus]